MSVTNGIVGKGFETFVRVRYGEIADDDADARTQLEAAYYAGALECLKQITKAMALDRGDGANVVSVLDKLRLEMHEFARAVDRGEL